MTKARKVLHVATILLEVRWTQFAVGLPHNRQTEDYAILTAQLVRS